MIARNIRAATAAGLIAGAAPAQGPELPAGLDIPPQAADGSFRTINSGIGPEMTVWHVRSALNVAALSCHEVSQKTLIADYNALIAKQKKTFAAVDAALRQADQSQYGDGWRVQHDLHMTQLYNFFSQPLAHMEFCGVAAAIADEAEAAPPGGFAAFAPGALMRLEAPFLALYRRYDNYRRAYAAWQRDAATETPATGGPPSPGHGLDLAGVPAPAVAGAAALHH